MADLRAIQGVMAVRDVIDAGAHQDGHQRRTFCHRLDPISYFTDVEFLARYRLSKESFDALLSEIRHRLPSSRDRRGKKILVDSFKYKELTLIFYRIFGVYVDSKSL